MSQSFDTVVEQLANAKNPVCVTAAAGCGKTEAIVRAVSLAEGKQLILTHTNAGVAALRSRLRRKGVPESKYRVETIASWLFKYTSAYPSMSGLRQRSPKGNDWEEVYPAAERLFDHYFIRQVLAASYTGIFVDEYQDCTQRQHAIVLKMANWLPVRVLGDPMQGIFGFGSNVPVDWNMDVTNHFVVLPDLTVPFRWSEDRNPQLGKQLIRIREFLMNHQPVNMMEYSEVQWHMWTEAAEVDACRKTLVMVSTGKHTIAGIHAGQKIQVQGGREHLDRITGRKLGGLFQCIEEMDCYSLSNRAKFIDGCLQRNNLKCLRWNMEQCLSEGLVDNQAIQASELRTALGDLEIKGVSAIPYLIDAALKTQLVYRRELFIEMKRAAQEYITGRYATFEEAAYSARTKTRVYGRKPEPRIISRTLLIKGLEFDHAIVLDAGRLLDRENFYVAITRGARTLTVLSQTPIIEFSAPQHQTRQR